MKKFLTSGIATFLLLIAVASIKAQDAQNPWHLIAFEDGKEVAFYNTEMITGMEVTEQNVTIVLDNGKKFFHPIAAATFSFEPRAKGTATANDNITASPWTVYYANNKLHFSEKVNGIAVYAATGALVTKFDGNRTDVPVSLAPGIYIVQAGDRSAKLLVNNNNGGAVAQSATEAKSSVHPSALVDLRADDVIREYWIITTASGSTKSIKIPEIEEFHFTANHSIVFTSKNMITTELSNYQSTEFAIEPFQLPPADPIELTVRQKEKVSTDNRFAFSMFKEVSAESNTFFSPLSLNLALGMLYNGSSGDTRTEMAEVLGMGDFTETEVNEYYQKISQTLLEIDPQTEMGIANSIWYRDGFPVKQPFMDINREYFDATVHALDFNNPDAADSINNWCAEKTNDKIKKIVEKPIPDDMMMYLINALYFKSRWMHEFDKANTKMEDFTLADNQKKQVNMMRQLSTFPYYKDDYIQCVEMPYGNQAFSMVAIMPVDGSDIGQLIDYLDDEKWQDIVQKLNVREISLSLPRFKVESEFSSLEVILRNAGMKLISDRDLANFANISDLKLYVSSIIQKTFVEVNEAGTEAAAVTSIGMAIGESPPPPPSFTANRPFLYLIKEKSTGTILFIGRMDDPVE
ncbi:MAG: serpin family protein [Tannerella sp.]|jgi:serpin B|nr:serpin family protein [Tannerella sp.]